MNHDWGRTRTQRRKRECLLCGCKRRIKKGTKATWEYRPYAGWWGPNVGCIGRRKP